LFYYYKFLRKSNDISNLLDECESRMLAERKPFLICCLKDGKLYYDCSSPFRPGDYVIVQVNLNSFSIPYEPYYVCGYSELIDEGKTLSKFKATTNIIEKGISCSSQFSQAEYHHGVAYGMVPNQTQIVFLEIKTFPSLDFDNKEEFLKAWDEVVTLVSIRGVGEIE